MSKQASGTLVGGNIGTISEGSPYSDIGQQKPVMTEEEIQYQENHSNRIRHELEMREVMHQNECRLIEELFGVKLGKHTETDKSCHIWQDISILTGEKENHEVELIDDPTSQVGQSFSSQTSMGLASNEGKEFRLMKLKNAIDFQHIKTSNEAYEVLDHEITNEATLVQYLRRIKRNLRSSQTGKVLGISDAQVRKVIEAEKEHDARNVHYYDGNPSLPTTREITKDEYEKLKVANIKKYKKN